MKTGCFQKKEDNGHAFDLLRQVVTLVIREAIMATIIRVDGTEEELKDTSLKGCRGLSAATSKSSRWMTGDVSL